MFKDVDMLSSQGTGFSNCGVIRDSAPIVPGPAHGEASKGN